MNRIFRTRKERALGGVKRLVLLFVLYTLVLDDEGPTGVELLARSFGLSHTCAKYIALLVLGGMYWNFFAGLIGILRAIFARAEGDEARKKGVPYAPFGTRVTMLAPSPLVHHAAAIKLGTILLFFFGGSFGLALCDVESRLAVNVVLTVGYSLWFVQWLLCSTLLWTSRAEVGLDGVYICRSKRFIPFATSDVPVPKPWGFEIWRDDRLLVRLRLSVREAYLRREIGAMLAHATQPRGTARANQAIVTLLEKGPRPAGYRTSSLTRDDLWRIAEANDVPIRARVEAIDLLSAEEQAGDAERLRLLTESSANPAFRDARRAVR